MQKKSYKLNSDIVRFIKNEKIKDQDLSCRELVKILQNKHNIKLSKSTVNNIIKDQGLSGPLGRKGKVLKSVVNAPLDNMVIFFLKAAQVALQVIESMSNEIKSFMPGESLIHIMRKQELVLFQPFFAKDGTKAKTSIPDGLMQIAGGIYNWRAISSYLDKLQDVKDIAPIMLNTLKAGLSEAAYLRIKLANNEIFYLDAQLHSVYSHLEMPRVFSVSINKIKSYIEKSFINPISPIVVFNFLQKEASSSGLLNFLAAAGAPIVTNPIVEIKAFSSNDIEAYSYNFMHRPKRIDFIMGLSPTQSNLWEIREVTREYQPVLCEFIWESLYAAEAQIGISQPKSNQQITLRGAILTNYPNSEGKLILVTNIPKEEASIEAIVKEYFRHWPNFDDTYQDYQTKSRISSRSMLDYSTLIYLNSLKINMLDTKAILQFWREALEVYCRRYFLPVEWQALDSAQLKERLYSLKASVSRKRDWLWVDFIIPSDYYYFRELAYACNRVNEHNLVCSTGERLFFRVKFA